MNIESVPQLSPMQLCASVSYNARLQARILWRTLGPAYCPTPMPASRLHVHTLSDGVEGLERARSHDYDLHEATKPTTRRFIEFTFGPASISP